MPSDYVTVGGTTFFTADDGDTGGELWRTDGTAQRHLSPHGYLPWCCSSYPGYFAVTDHLYFFRASRRRPEFFPLGERRHSGDHLRAHVGRHHC